MNVRALYLPLSRFLHSEESYLWCYEGENFSCLRWLSGSALLQRFPCGVGRFVWCRNRREWVVLVKF